MKIKALGAFLLGVVILSHTTPVSARDVEPGFKEIFDGKTLTGWDGSPDLWSVREGAITGETTAAKPAKENTFLVWTNGVVGDFELRCTFRLLPGDSQGFANSGIQYRSKVVKPSYWVVAGYQADMEAGKTYSGILYEEKGRGILANRGEKVLIHADGKKELVGKTGDSNAIEAAIKKGDWNEYVVIAQGNHLIHRINGKLTIEVTDEEAAKAAKAGVLALQLHAGPPMLVQFKNIRIQTLK